MKHDTLTCSGLAPGDLSASTFAPASAGGALPCAGTSRLCCAQEQADLRPGQAQVGQCCALAQAGALPWTAQDPTMRFVAEFSAPVVRDPFLGGLGVHAADACVQHRRPHAILLDDRSGRIEHAVTTPPVTKIDADGLLWLYLCGRS